MGEKAWQFVALASEGAFVSAAIAHLGYLGFVFAVAYDRETTQTEAFQLVIPLALGVKVAREAGAGRSELFPPWGVMRIDPAPRTLQLNLPIFRAEAALDAVEPWRVEWPIGSHGRNRTHKEMGFACRGRLYLRDRSLSLDGFGLMDWTRGSPARETAWRWAAGVGRAGDRLIAWNLRTGFDDPAQVENAIWIDGVPQAAGRARLEPGPAWTVSAGGLELAFDSHGERHEDLNLGIIASRYRQPWGRFHGQFEGVPLEGYGVVEEHWARW